MKKLSTLFAASVCAVLVLSAIPAGAAGAGKFDLLGPTGNAFCDGSGVIAGAPGGFGFAVINAPANGTVKTTVSLKGQQPNTTYNIRLIQGIADCFTVDATVTTNGQGNGTGQWSEPSVSSTALVAVDGGGDVFVTATYSQ